MRDYQQKDSKQKKGIRTFLRMHHKVYKNSTKHICQFVYLHFVWKCDKKYLSSLLNLDAKISTQTFKASKISEFSLANNRLNSIKIK